MMSHDLHKPTYQDLQGWIQIMRKQKDASLADEGKCPLLDEFLLTRRLPPISSTYEKEHVVRRSSSLFR